MEEKTMERKYAALAENILSHIGGKDNINQVFPQCPGQCLFQKAKIFFGLLLGHLAQGLV